MRIPSAERRWLVVFAAILLVLTSMPYLLGYALDGDDWRFSGFVFGVDDGNTYIAKMLRGASGDWLFRTPYTAEVQAGFVAFLPYYLLGKLAAGAEMHGQLVALFHLFRLAAGFVMIWASYAFVAYLIEDLHLRRLGTILAVCGGGLGFLQLFGLQAFWGGRAPLEFYSPETFGFLSVFGLPHLAMARALLLAGMLFALQALEEQNMKLSLLAGGLWLLLGLMQPLTVVTAWVVLVVYYLLRWRLDWNHRAEYAPRGMLALVIAAVSAPVVVYNFLSFLFDPFLRGWGAQNRIFSPPPQDYVMAFGLILPLALVGLQTAYSHKKQSLLLAGWVLAFPLLAYAPYNLQRRLPEGIWVALVILALIGLQRMSGMWKKVGRMAIYTALVTTAMVYLGALITVAKPAAPLYITKDVVEAYEYLANHAQKDDVVLATFEISNALPAYAPLRTITGHGPESVRADEINPRVQAFEQPATTDEERISLLNEFGVRYYIHAPSLEHWTAGDAVYLQKVFENGSVQVYEISGLVK